MTEAAVRLRDELARLPENERAAIARFLIESLDPAVDSDDDLAWEQELARREVEIRTGKALGEPAETVFAQLREKHR